MIQKIKGAVSARAAALRSDENGMEAAQVILILGIVVIVLLPVIGLIVNALKAQGTKVVTGINNVK